jgi:RNA polymerase sigma-54 factor
MAAEAAASRFGLRMTEEFGHQQLLSPMAVQVLASLALNQTEVDALVAARAAENPLLVVGPPRRCRWCARGLRLGRCPQCAQGTVLVREPVAVMNEREELRVQARLLVRPAVAPLVDLVVAQLDGRGLLSAPSTAQAACTAGQWAEAVLAVQAAGPPGIAAPDVRSCLLAQAEWHASRGGPALLVPIVDRHLGRVAAGEHAAIAAALDASIAEVDGAVAFLRARLHPSAMATATVAVEVGAPPDIIVRRQGDGLDVIVLGATDLGLGVDPELDALRPVDGAGVWLVERRVDARALLDLVDRRASALRRVAGVVVHVQRDFVLHGRTAHRPLTRAAVADALGVHPSTVSRAVQGAVVAMPDGGVLPLAAFFGTAVAVVDCLARMLASTNPPRSDADAAVRLGLAGHVVARRTVAKYRHLLDAAVVGGAKPPSG